MKNRDQNTTNRLKFLYEIYMISLYSINIYPAEIYKHNYTGFVSINTQYIKVEIA